MVCVIQVCWQLASRMRNKLRPDPATKLSANLYNNRPLLCVQWKTPDNGQWNCPKHVEFYSKIKLEKIVHLVSFIVRSWESVRFSRSFLCSIGLVILRMYPVTGILYWIKWHIDVSGPLSLRHCSFWGCRWRRRLLYVDGNCECIE